MKELQIGHTLCSPEALKTPRKIRIRQNAQQQRCVQPKKVPVFSYFLSLLFPCHFPASFDIILQPIIHYRKLFTLSTAFSTQQNPFIHKALLNRTPVFPIAAKPVGGRLDTPFYVDIILFPLFPAGQIFFSLSITLIPPLEKQHPMSGCCFFTNITNQNSASLSSMVA